jgi:hypothetical protein
MDPLDAVIQVTDHTAILTSNLSILVGPNQERSSEATGQTSDRSECQHGICGYRAAVSDEDDDRASRNDADGPLPIPASLSMGGRLLNQPHVDIDDFVERLVKLNAYHVRVHGSRPTGSIRTVD